MAAKGGGKYGGGDGTLVTPVDRTAVTVTVTTAAAGIPFRGGVPTGRRRCTVTGRRVQ